MHRYDYGTTKQSPGDFVIHVGKFKGKRLRDIPDHDWLRWVCQQEWCSKHAKERIETFLALPTTRYKLS